MKTTCFIAALTLVTAFTYAKDKIRHTFVLSLGDITTANDVDNGEMRRLFDRYGRRFAYFERNGRTYLIRDAATLERFEAMYAPQMQLGQQQAELGRHQAELGRKQADLGREQARLGRMQADGSNDDDELTRKQNELAEKQNQLAEKQNELGAKQNKMGDRQNELSREVERRIQPMLDEAIRNGIAIEVH